MRADLVPLGVLFTYEAGRGKESFYRELYGYEDSSYHGKYSYEREGLLSRVEHVKVSESTLLVKQDDAEELRQLIEEHDVDYTEHVVILHEDEALQLGVKHEHEWQDLLEELKGSDDFTIRLEV